MGVAVVRLFRSDKGVRRSVQSRGRAERRRGSGVTTTTQADRPNRAPNGTPERSITMRPRYHWALLALALAAGATVGQEKGDKGEKNDPRGKPDPGAIEVRFADDSTVKMVLLHSNIEVTTRYGKLTVPVSELRRIEFGLRITEDTAKKIAAAVARLGSREFKQRDAAVAELLALREPS